MYFGTKEEEEEEEKGNAWVMYPARNSNGFKQQQLYFNIIDAYNLLVLHRHSDQQAKEVIYRGSLPGRADNIRRW